MSAVTDATTGPPGSEAGNDHDSSGGTGTPSGGHRGSEARRPRPVFLLVGVALAVVLAIGLFTGIGTNHSSRPGAGSQVPSFTVPKLSGSGSVGVPADGGGNGRPAVLIFFASWCTPCQSEMPGLAALWRQEQATKSPLRKVALLGIDAFDPTGAGRRFVSASGVSFPVGTDRNYDLTEGTFYFTGLPEAVFVNGNGTIAAIQLGAVSPTQLRQWQQRLLSGG